MNHNNSKKENVGRKQCNEDEKQWTKLVSEEKKPTKAIKWRLVKLSSEDEVAHGRWTMLHNDGIQNFGWNFNFKSKHNCVRKQS